LLGEIRVREKQSDDKDFTENLQQLRANIDVIDEELLKLLQSRMEISRQIGEYKKAHNVAIVQAQRWDEILGEMVKEGAAHGLPEEFVAAVYNAIHTASVQAQNEILESE